MYGKLFESIYDGTLVEDWQALITFQQMIILCDSDGILDMTVGAISRRTGIPIKHIKHGVEILEGEDPESRSSNENGKRIIRIDEHREWGWTIVNHKHYRDLRTANDRREYMRIYMRNKREKLTKANESLPVSKLAHTDVNADTNKTSTSAQKVPYQKIVDIYHEILPSWPRVVKLNDTRRGYIKRLWFEDELPDLNNWTNFFKYVSQSDFLMGKTGQNDNYSFKPSLEWITKPSNYLKILEKNYHGKI